MVQALTTILALMMLVSGLFFMLVAAIGVARMPDAYHRMHTATKGVTLGITSLMIAAALVMAGESDTDLVALTTKTVLVILFQFVANPVGAHMLAKAAHHDDAPMWAGTLSDELQERSGSGDQGSGS